MRKKLRIPLLVLLTALAAYAVIRVPQWKTEDDIREAVFRYQFAHIGATLTPPPNAYYLSIPVFGVDAGARAGFLKRLARYRPIVRSVAECTTEKMCVQDRLTRKNGLILRVGRILRVGWDRARVEGGCYLNGTGASGNVYTVVRKHGHWVVIRDKLLWIS